MTGVTLKMVSSMLGFAAIFLCLSYREAAAYIDPGTGGMLLQLLLGGIAGAFVVLKLYWNRFRLAVMRLLGRKPKTKKAESN